jgi:hypothetical protein
MKNTQPCRITKNFEYIGQRLDILLWQCRQPVMMLFCCYQTNLSHQNPEILFLIHLVYYTIFAPNEHNKIVLVAVRRKNLPGNYSRGGLLLMLTAK